MRHRLPPGAKRSHAVLVETSDGATLRLACRLPAVEGATGYPKGIHGRGQSVLGKELKDLESFWGIFRVSCPKDAPDALPGKTPGPGIQHAEHAWLSTLIKGVPKVSELMQ